MLEIGNFGQAMLFMFSFAGMLITGPFFVMYASHCYLTTLTGSSGGVDRFVWPRESVYEWFGQGTIIVGILFLWSTLTLPVVGVAALAASTEWAVAVWFGLLLMLAPISLCSALTAASPLMFLNPVLIGRLLRHVKALGYVYFLTTPLFLFVLGGMWLFVLRRNVLGMLMVAVFFAPALLLHARAWGRLCWFVLNYDRKPRRKKKKKKHDDDDEPVMNVELEAAEEPGDDAAYEVKSHAPAERAVRLADVYQEQRTYEERLRRRAGEMNPDPLSDPPIPTFAVALGPRVIGYLGDADPLGAWLKLGLFTMLELLLLFIMLGA